MNLEQNVSRRDLIRSAANTAVVAGLAITAEAVWSNNQRVGQINEQLPEPSKDYMEIANAQQAEIVHAMVQDAKHPTGDSEYTPKDPNAFAASQHILDNVSNRQGLLGGQQTIFQEETGIGVISTVGGLVGRFALRFRARTGQPLQQEIISSPIQSDIQSV